MYSLKGGKRGADVHGGTVRQSGYGCKYLPHLTLSLENFPAPRAASRTTAEVACNPAYAGASASPALPITPVPGGGVLPATPPNTPAPKASTTGYSSTAMISTSPLAKATRPARRTASSPSGG